MYHICPDQQETPGLRTFLYCKRVPQNSFHDPCLFQKNAPSDLYISPHILLFPGRHLPPLCSVAHAHKPSHYNMTVHSIAGAYTTIGSHFSSVPCGRAPAEHIGLRHLSALSSCSLHSPLFSHCSPVSSPSTKCAVHAIAIETLERNAASGQLLEKCVNTIRFLAIDAVENAKSGHAGMPMGCAALGHILYDEVMRYNPKNPYWFNRDRFVLSAGHGCVLQYALLYLAGYDSISVRPLLQLLLQYQCLQFKVPRTISWKLRLCTMDSSLLFCFFFWSKS